MELPIVEQNITFVDTDGPDHGQKNDTSLEFAWFFPTAHPVCWKTATFAHEVNEIYASKMDCDEDINNSIASLESTDVSSDGESTVGSYSKEQKEIISFGFDGRTNGCAHRFRTAFGNPQERHVCVFAFPHGDYWTAQYVDESHEVCLRPRNELGPADFKESGTAVCGFVHEEQQDYSRFVP
jgi:hypothetical protein